MAPIPGDSWTERRFGHAVARVQPNWSSRPTTESSLRCSCAAAELHRSNESVRSILRNPVAAAELA